MQPPKIREAPASADSPGGGAITPLLGLLSRCGEVSMRVVQAGDDLVETRYYIIFSSSIQHA